GCGDGHEPNVPSRFEVWRAKPGAGVIVFRITAAGQARDYSIAPPSDSRANPVNTPGRVRETPQTGRRPAPAHGARTGLARSVSQGAPPAVDPEARPTTACCLRQSFGGQLDRPVALHARAGRDQLADDHVLLEPEEGVHFALGRRVGEHPGRLLEGG